MSATSSYIPSPKYKKGVGNRWFRYRNLAYHNYQRTTRTEETRYWYSTYLPLGKWAFPGDVITPRDKPPPFG